MCLLCSEGWLTKGRGSCTQVPPDKFKLVVVAIGKWNGRNPTGNGRKGIFGRGTHKKVNAFKIPCTMSSPPRKNRAQNRHSWMAILKIHFKFNFHFWNYFCQPAHSAELGFRKWKDGNMVVAEDAGRLLWRGCFPMPELNPKVVKILLLSWAIASKT